MHTARRPGSDRGKEYQNRAAKPGVDQSAPPGSNQSEKHTTYCKRTGSALATQNSNRKHRPRRLPLIDLGCHGFPPRACPLLVAKTELLNMFCRAADLMFRPAGTNSEDTGLLTGSSKFAQSTARPVDRTRHFLIFARGYSSFTKTIVAFLLGFVSFVSLFPLPPRTYGPGRRVMVVVHWVLLLSSKKISHVMLAY